MATPRLMIEKLSGSVGTNELSEWENSFVGDLVDKIDGQPHLALTPNQLATLTRIYDKVFA
jgi:hypothetical protein